MYWQQSASCSRKFAWSSASWYETNHPKKSFPALVGYAASTGSFKCLPKAIVYESKIFKLLGDACKLLCYVMAANPVDCREKLCSSNNEAERDVCVRMVGMKRLGATATKNLDLTYQALFA